MKHAIHTDKTWAIAYDAGLLEVPGVEFFNVDYWRSRQALAGEAVGRGSAWFIESPHGPVVLRQYLRGGWAAKFSRQAYLFTCVSRSRPFREFHLLAELSEKGLPVPRPVAALCQYHGLLSTGALMTARIASAKTLADSLSAGSMLEGTWSRIGQCIRRFHRAGVWHADLNARNIMLDTGLQVYLIDFDRARYNPGAVVNGEGNLRRLKRSMIKLWPAERDAEMHTAWAQLRAAYDE